MEQSQDISQCKIIVDAMGGDYAPQNVVVGAIQAAKEDSTIELFLCGRKKEIVDLLKIHQLIFNEDHIIDASEIISMSDTPTTALKSKPDSSIVVCAKFVKDKRADAFVSAGNTGAVVAASTLIIGRLKGVERPTIGSFIPNVSGITTLFDVGAFVDSKPEHLVGFGLMSSLYVKEIYGISKPTLGILSTGEEDEKGNKVTKEAAEILRKSNLNFVGNVEGRDILRGKVNIVICDGFIGNILLKFGESVPSLLRFLIKEYASKNFFNKLKIGLLKNSLKKALEPLNPDLYGGVPLLGINGITIIGHGSSSVLAIKNMVLRAKEMYNKKLVSKIEESLKELLNLEYEKS
jgi:glycerol-3-phosphate acyltransferase PlsX